MPRTIDAIELQTGVTLPYVEQGDPSGTPLILLHGYSDSAHSFSLMLPHLPESVHAYAVTQRGHGDASRPEDGYAVEDYSADVLAFMDALGIDAAVIVGHSNGGYTAQRFAIDHPERVLGLVLISTFTKFAGNPAIDELGDAVMALNEPVDRGFIREFQAGTAHQPLSPDFFETVVEESAKMPARVWQEFLEQLFVSPPPLTTGTITAPTLILAGEHDPLSTPPETVAEAIPESEAIVYLDTAHCPHWEHPGHAAADVMSLVTRCTAVPA
jgi:non-heme chloroperoxidase